MKFLDRKHIKLTLWLILAWVLAAYLFITVRYMGHWDLATNPMDKSLPMDFRLFFVLATLGGTVVGILYGCMEIVFERQIFRRMSYGRLILTKTVVYFLILSLSFAGMTITDFIVITGGFDFRKWFEVFLGVRLTIPLLYMSVVTVLIIHQTDQQQVWSG